MTKNRYVVKDLASHILLVLSEEKITKASNWLIQTEVLNAVRERYNQRIMPESISRTWRQMREPGENQVVRCLAEEKKASNGRWFTEWTIEEVLVGGVWLPWNTMLQEA